MAAELDLVDRQLNVSCPVSVCKPIAALSGAPSVVIQNVLSTFGAQLAAQGVRVAGVIEVSLETPANVKRQLALAEIEGTAPFPMSQNLGAGSLACNLDVSGLSQACRALEVTLGPGVDLVIISKFGKQEAAGHGLRDAFLLAIAEGIPVLTAVNPALLPEWSQFVGDLGELLPADFDALNNWLQKLRKSDHPR